MNFGAFSLETTSATPENYRLAVRAASEDAPSATEIKASSASIVRSLSTEAINVYMSFHMDGTLFDAATDWDAAPNKGAKDKTVKYSVIEPAMLQPDTSYTLYLVAEGGTEVLTLLDFSTDPAPATIGDNAIYNMPTGYKYTIRRGEPFLLVGKIGDMKNVSHFYMDDQNIVLISNADNENSYPSVGLTNVLYFSSEVESSPDSVVMLAKTFASQNQTAQTVKILLNTANTGQNYNVTSNFLIQETPDTTQ